jgi:hypothetical protein
MTSWSRLLFRQYIAKCMGASVTYRRVLDWMIGFIDTLQVVTTNNYNTIADFHKTNHSTLSLLSLLSLVFTL